MEEEEVPLNNSNNHNTTTFFKDRTAVMPMWKKLIPSQLRESLFRVDLSEGNSRFIITNMVTDYFKSPRFAKHMFRIGLFVCCLFLVLVLIPLLTTASFAGDFMKIHDHKDGVTYEFVPSDDAVNRLGLVQSRMLKNRNYPFRSIKQDEFEVGHIDLDTQSGYFNPPKSDSADSMNWFQSSVGGGESYTETSSTSGGGGKKMDIIVDLDKLENALEANCRNLKSGGGGGGDDEKGCSCLSAPHIGIPVRAIYTKSTGMMANPTVDVVKRIINKRIEFTSPISEIKIDSGDVPHTIRVDYYTSWGSIDKIKKERKKLYGKEAACVYVTSIELDFKKETHSKNNNGDTTDQNSSREL